MKKNPLSFQVVNKIVDVHGKTYQIFELFREYGHLINSAFGIYGQRQLMYFPWAEPNQRFKEKINGKWIHIFAKLGLVNFKTVTVKKAFVTGQELDHILRSVSGALSYREDGDTIEILDYEDNVISTYDIDQTTGELK